MTRVSAHKLARALADRLGDVLPPPFTVDGEAGVIRLYADGDRIDHSHNPGLVEWDDEDGDNGAEDVEQDAAERAASAAWATVNEIQDQVARHRASWWPEDAGQGMALPETAVEADAIHVWFAHPDGSLALALRPIPLADLLAD